MKKLATLITLATLATGAFAHSPVDTTTPENGAVISEVPESISFSFAGEIRLTRVDMTHEDHPTVRLDLGEQTNFARDFVVPLQAMGGGNYHIEWRGLGMDGHAMQGEFSFSVD